MFRNIKPVKDIKTQIFLVGGRWLLWIFKISQIILYSSILKQTQEIHDKQVPEYDFNK